MEQIHGLMESVDVIIIGAGLSGIGAACHITKNFPSKKLLIFEGRDNLGGTWDLFRYPGVRSDSDMHTLGFSFEPWKNQKSIADGSSILAYLQATASKYNISKNIRFGHSVIRASWSSADSLWTLEVRQGSDEKPHCFFTCKFIHSCCGYYDYSEGYAPLFPNMSVFNGSIVHPQFWPNNVDYKEKHVVIIGSGATAITLLPALAKLAKHVTMLQRSPTYVYSMSSEDKFCLLLLSLFPSSIAYTLSRWNNILFQYYTFKLARKFPRFFKMALRYLVQQEVGSSVDVDKHFNPSYNPWDQRLCVVPDGDLFCVLRSGSASVVTDHIEEFTSHGILLKSGQ